MNDDVERKRTSSLNDQLIATMASLDLDGDGQINSVEFSLLIQRLQRLREGEERLLLYLMPVDGDGNDRLDQDELSRLLQSIGQFSPHVQGTIPGFHQREAESELARFRRSPALELNAALTRILVGYHFNLPSLKLIPKSPAEAGLLFCAFPKMGFVTFSSLIELQVLGELDQKKIGVLCARADVAVDDCNGSSNSSLMLPPTWNHPTAVLGRHGYRSLHAWAYRVHVLVSSVGRDWIKILYVLWVDVWFLMGC